MMMTTTTMNDDDDDDVGEFGAHTKTTTTTTTKRRRRSHKVAHVTKQGAQEHRYAARMNVARGRVIAVEQTQAKIKLDNSTSRQSKHSRSHLSTLHAKREN